MSRHLAEVWVLYPPPTMPEVPLHVVAGGGSDGGLRLPAMRGLWRYLAGAAVVAGLGFYVGGLVNDPASTPGPAPSVALASEATVRTAGLVGSPTAELYVSQP